MSGPIAFVSPSGDARAGSNWNPAAPPTSLSGSFGGAGASSAPPAVATPAIQQSRNDRGSNVTVPYARLVPLRGPEGATGDKDTDKALLAQGIRAPNEYDGLETGEVAFVMGRVFSGGEGDRAALQHTAHSGLGFGPDRFQRLASWAWVQSVFHQRFAGAAFRLDLLHVNAPQIKAASARLLEYAPVLQGSSLLEVPDVAHLLKRLDPNAAAAPNTTHLDKANLVAILDANAATVQTTAVLAANVVDSPAFGPNAGEGFFNGLFVMEPGPFLRGRMNSVAPVDLPCLGAALSYAAPKDDHSVPRNLGDALAFEALFAQLELLGAMEWSPDGVVMSKLESPSGDPLGSAALDARQAQLFNVAVQGPALLKTFAGKPELACLPGDDVFVLVVADVASLVAKDAGSAIDEVTGRRTAATNAVAEAVQRAGEIRSAQTPAEKTTTKGAVGALYAAAPAETYEAVDAASAEATLIDDARAQVEGENAGNFQAAIDGAAAGTVNGFVEATLRVQRCEKELRSAADSQAAQSLLDRARAHRDRYFKSDHPDFEEKWSEVAEELRKGTRSVSASVCTNLRLVLHTSGSLSNHSRSSDPQKTRLRLKRGAPQAIDVAAENVVCAEYVLGGWSLGSVLDSAAGRSTVGAQNRNAPNSSSLSINVNVQPVSGDELYRRYGVPGVEQRGALQTPPSGGNPKTRAAMAAIGLDPREELHWPEASEL